MLVKERTFEEIALAEPDRKWELHHGQMREKPAMSMAHNRVAMRLVRQLAPQLDYDRYDIRADMGRVRRTGANYYIPDVYVIPVPGNRAITDDHVLEVFDEPLMLIVEVWSPSTGDYDSEEKLDEYKKRGDLEIWRLHPLDLTCTAWRRQPDGGYSVTVYLGGTVELASIPGVVVDLVALFV